MIDVPEAYYTQYSIAPLTLQLLVENAVKHNRMSNKEPVVVHIEARGEDLVVWNTLHPRPQNEASTGFGLQNIVNRYTLLTPRRVRITEEAGAFTIQIPLLS